MSDPQGAGYNVLQATIAISSRGGAGEGISGGDADAVAVHSCAVDGFYFLCYSRRVWVHWSFSSDSTFCNIDSAVDMGYFSIKNRFVELTLAGFVSLLLVHVIINIGMTLGLIPVIGVPLPFVLMVALHWLEI